MSCCCSICNCGSNFSGMWRLCENYYEYERSVNIFVGTVNINVVCEGRLITVVNGSV